MRCPFYRAEDLAGFDPDVDLGDPGQHGGCGAIQLTNSIEQEARTYLERIDAQDGMVSAIERGWVQREIEDAAYPPPASRRCR